MGSASCMLRCGIFP